MAEAKIIDVKDFKLNQGSTGSAFYLITDQGMGWVNVGEDNGTNLRIWACATAVWAAKRGGADNVNAVLHYQHLIGNATDSHFEGVERIHLEPPQ